MRKCVLGLQAFSPAFEGEFHLALDQVSNMAIEAPVFLDERAAQLEQPNPLAVSFDHLVASTGSYGPPRNGLEVNTGTVHVDLIENG
jgi:hypothetical protein